MSGRMSFVVARPEDQTRRTIEERLESGESSARQSLDPVDTSGDSSKKTTTLEDEDDEEEEQPLQCVGRSFGRWVEHKTTT